MKTPLVITDLTRMQHGRVCIAAYRRDYRCVRPVLPHGIMETWLFDGDQPIIRPFAVVELDLLEEQPDPPHTEDWVVDQEHRVWFKELPLDRRWNILAHIEDPSVAAIFGADITHEHGWFVEAGAGSRSLGTVRAHQIHALHYNLQEDGKRSYYLVFSDLAGERYRLSVTDLAFRRYLGHLHEQRHMRESRAAHMLMNMIGRAQTYLRIGLARGWEKHPDRCYLQITGVYTWPDYLDGCCFADFGAMGEERQSGVPEGDLPF